MGKSKKAVIVVFHSMKAAAQAVALACVNRRTAEGEFDNAKALRDAAQIEMRIVVKQAAQSGFTLEARATPANFAGAVMAALLSAGFARQTVRNVISELRGQSGVKGKKTPKAKRSKTTAGPISGFSLELKPAAQPDVVKNKVIKLAEYLKAEYPSDEKMLRIAAYLIDVSDE
jgi:hypothetical protein